MSTQQMPIVPFELHVKSIFPQQGRRVLICTKLIRHVPGKRSVYTARFDDNQAIAKIYETKFRPKSRLLNEWTKIDRLARAGLDSPKLHFYGRSENNRWVIVTEYIANSATALELYNKAESPLEKVQVMMPLFSELARMNEAGILQKDLHLGNFLITGEKVFPLDTATMKFQSQPLGKTQSLRQLAVLSWYVPKEVRAELPRLLDSYAGLRGWKLTRNDRQTIEDYMQKHISMEIKRQLKKTLRTSGRKIRFEENNFVAVFDRTLCEDLDVPAFLSGIDTFIETGQVLKSRNTSFLSRVTVKAEDVVVKRYNHKGLWHSIRQSFRTSRARRSWLHGHRLTILGVNTPKPLAFIEKRIGLLLWTSYIITGYVPGPNLDELFNNMNLSDEKKQDLYRQIGEMMTAMHKNRITHGDFKRTNFVVSKDRVYVTDLDAMKVHLPGPLFRRRCLKDTGRLERMFS